MFYHPTLLVWKKSFFFIFSVYFWKKCTVTLPGKNILYWVKNEGWLAFIFGLQFFSPAKQNNSFPESWFLRGPSQELTLVPPARQLPGSLTGWCSGHVSRQTAKKKGHLRAACQVEVRKATYIPRELGVMLGKEQSSLQTVWGINWVNIWSFQII